MEGAGSGSGESGAAGTISSGGSSSTSTSGSRSSSTVEPLAARLQQGLRLSPQPQQQPNESQGHRRAASVPMPPARPRAAPSLLHDPLVKAFNPREIQVEVEPEPGAVGDRVLVRTVTVYNQSDVELGDSLTLTAEATELWHLERLPVGALPRGQRAVLTLRLRVKSDLRRPFEDAIPDTYTLTLSHASPSPPNSNGGASSSLRPPLVIAYRFPSSMRSYLKGLPGMAPRRLVTVSPEEEERPEDGAADITSTSSSSIISGSGGSGGGQSRRRPRPRPAPCNLLLLGPAGAGKSTLLAHFLTLLSDRDRVNLGGVRTCSTSEHGTLELRAYPLPNVSSVAVWDTRGITSSNYLREEIRGILEGVFPEKGLDIERADDARVAALAAAGRATRAFRRQQAVIVVIPEGLLQSRVELDHLRRQLQQVQRAGLNPLVCLTHVDLVYPILRQDPNADVPDLRESRREAARQLGVEANRVLHFVPYKDEELRRFAIDRLAYKVLATALQLAAEYVESDEPFLGAAEGLIEALFPSTTTATATPMAAAAAGGGFGSGAAASAAVMAGSPPAPAAAAATGAWGGGGGAGLDSPSPSPPPAYADVMASGHASPLQRFLPPADAPAAAPPRVVDAGVGLAGSAAGERERPVPVPEDSTVVADRSPEVAPPPHVRRLASDGTEAYNTSGSGVGVGGGGGFRGWEDEDGDGFDDGVSSLHGSFYSEDGTFQEPYMRGGGGAQGAGRAL